MSQTTSQTFSLKDGFNQSGLYKGYNSALGEHFDVLYSAGLNDNDSLPTALILPGYRGDAIEGPNNKALASMLEKKGYSILQINFAGFDHYTSPLYCSRPDCATLSSNIADVKNVLDCLGPKDHFMIANCDAANIAVHSFNEYTRAVIANIPAPDSVENILLPAMSPQDVTKELYFKTITHHNGCALFG